MSEVKSRRLAALELLALDELTDKQAWQLDILTLKQVGWSIKKARSGYYEARNPSGEIDMGMDIFMSETEGWVWVRKVHPFCTSVDACLMLLSKYRYIVHHLMGSFRVRVYRDTDDAEGSFVDVRSLSLAMLKVWWNIQPD